MIKGLDSSVHNHAGNSSTTSRDGAPHDWRRLKADGVDYAAVRMTVGRYYRDPWGPYDLQAGQDAGIYMTGYHVPVPGQDNAAQVGNFMAHLGGLQPDYSVVIDFEIINDFLRSHGQSCFDYHVANLPRVNSQLPLTYTNQNVGNYLSNARGTRLWVSNPGAGGSYNTADQPAMPRLWEDWVIWQRSWTQGFDGIVDPTVDLNEYHGTLDEFRFEFGIVGGGEPVPPPDVSYATTRAGYNIRAEPLVEATTDMGNTQGGCKVKVLRVMGDWRQVEAWIHAGGLVE